MDALQLLKKDHRTVNALFKEFEALGDRAGKTKKKIVEKIIRELSVHAAIEEMVFYPAIRATAAKVEADEADDDVLEAIEEHHIVKWTLSELEKLEPEDERFEAKVTVLIESVRHHVKEEEEDLFKKVKQLFEPQELLALGEAMEAAKKMAPTRPHPRAPDHPPGNLVAGAVSAVLDRGREVVLEAVRGAADKMRGRNKDGAASKDQASVH